ARVAWIGLQYDLDLQRWVNGNGEAQSYFNWVGLTRDGMRPYNNYQPNQVVGASIFLSYLDADYNCDSELALFRTSLGASVVVEREQHVLDGDQRCAYRITPA
ncbi:MAG: hypothetical protein ACKO27_08375, partial [Ilumatobacteraceae bacterium]